MYDYNGRSLKLKPKIQIRPDLKYITDEMQEEVNTYLLKRFGYKFVERKPYRSTREIYV